MERLKRMSVFAKVVELGSFTAAARQLQMSVSSISQTVSKLEDELQVEHEGGDGADGDVVASDLASAEVEDDRDPGASQPFDEREVDGRDADSFHVRFEVALVDGAETFHVVLLAHEGLDHAQPGERLLHVDEDIGDAFPH